MSEHQISVDIVVVPRQVELKEGNVYLYRDGRLLDCGALECILMHTRGIDSLKQMAIADHFGGYFNEKGPHVMRGGEA